MAPPHSANPWIVYILLCADGTLYTGITTDMEHRIRTHEQGKGAKYLRGRAPFRLVYHEFQPTKSAALKREGYIKSLSKIQKQQLIDCV